MESMVERFVRYTSINTRSNEESTTIPSTQTQVDFATNVLVPDLKAIGPIYFNCRLVVHKMQSLLVHNV